MWKRWRDGIVGAFLGVVLAGGVVAYAADVDLVQIVPFRAQSLWLIKQARAILETYYVDAEDPVSEDVLVRGALRGMVSSLGDPYTRFTDPKQLQEEEIEMQGEYGGLGIYIGQRDGATLVISPIDGTPADRAGLKPKDMIVKIGDTYIVDWDQEKVVNHLRGEPGTKVTIWVRREGEDELLRFDLVREIINIKAVRFEMISKDLGYIRLNHFNQKCVEEMEDALEKIKAQKARGLIFDLRNNPGGLLDAAVEISDMFLDKGLIVGMKGRVPKATDQIFATGGTLWEKPMVVLINEGSASASEIVAGALKDHRRATVMGVKSFGKGSVQTLFPLQDGSGLYVTIAKYYTPSGFVIDHVGLSPDMAVKGDMEREISKDQQLRAAEKELRRMLATPRP